MSSFIPSDPAWRASFMLFAFVAVKKCTVFYSAPKRSTEVSKLCSDDVCQCAESRSSSSAAGSQLPPTSLSFVATVLMLCVVPSGPCHEVKDLFKTSTIKKGSRIQHACFHPGVDYSEDITLSHSPRHARPVTLTLSHSPSHTHPLTLTLSH